MKFLITGSNGLLGHKLAALTGKKGHVLVATSRGENRNPDISPDNYFPLDITNAEEVATTVRQHNPDVIINTAAMTNVDQCEQEPEHCWEMNVAGVENLVRSCEEGNHKLIHLSTDFVFDGTAGPYSEDDLPNPISHYGESKWRGEEIITQSTINWAIVRTVLVYGITPHMSRSNIILWVRESLKEGKTLKIVNDQWRTPTLAEDLALGCYLVAEKDARGIFNISGKDLLTPYEMSLATARHFKLDPSPIEKADSTTFTQPAKRPPRTGFLLDKARKELGYEPHSFNEGLTILEEQLQAYESL